MIPWVERVMDYDVRAKPNMITSTSGSRDLQMVRPPPYHLRARCVRPSARPRYASAAATPGDNVAADSGPGTLGGARVRAWVGWGSRCNPHANPYAQRVSLKAGA